jgi:hypothetical protein
LTRLLVVLVAAALIGLSFVVGTLVHVSSNSLWIPVIAALGASLLTAIAGFGIEAIRDAKAGIKEAQQRRRDAYVQFMIAAANHILLVSSLREIRKVGTAISLAGLTRDPVAFLREYTRELTPLNAAWTQVWLCGSQEAIAISNRFINATIPASGAATAPGKARPVVLSRFIGEEWTKEQIQEFGEAVQALGLARIEFAEVARRELGEFDVKMLAGISDEHQTKAEQGQT